MATISLEKSLLNEMSHIMGNDDLMAQTIKLPVLLLKSVRVEWNSNHSTLQISKTT